MKQGKAPAQAQTAQSPTTHRLAHLSGIPSDENPGQIKGAVSPSQVQLEEYVQALRCLAEEAGIFTRTEPLQKPVTTFSTLDKDIPNRVLTDYIWIGDYRGNIIYQNHIGEVADKLAASRCEIKYQTRGCRNTPSTTGQFTVVKDESVREDGYYVEVDTNQCEEETLIAAAQVAAAGSTDNSVSLTELINADDKELFIRCCHAFKQAGVMLNLVHAIQLQWVNENKQALAGDSCDGFQNYRVCFESEEVDSPRHAGVFGAKKAWQMSMDNDVSP
jgi:hypothetical protein